MPKDSTGRLPSQVQFVAAQNNDCDGLDGLLCTPHPVAKDDTATTDEDTAVIVRVLDNDSDSLQRALRVIALSVPTNGKATLNPQNTVTYSPDDNYFGSDTFDYTIENIHGGKASASVTITVRSVNDSPWIAPLIPNQLEQKNIIIQIALTPYEHDVESTGIDLDWSVSENTESAVSGANSDDDLLFFSPREGFEGSDIVLLTLTDADGAQVSQYVTLTWTSIHESRQAYLPLVVQTRCEIEVCDPSFEDQIGCWVQSGRLDGTTQSPKAHTGDYAARLGLELGYNGDYKCRGWILTGQACISQTLEILPCCDEPVLSFWYRVHSQDTLRGIGHDSFDVRINDELIMREGNREWSERKCQAPWDSGWTHFTTDALQAYRGQQVQLVQLSFCNFIRGTRKYATWTHIDDVEITCGWQRRIEPRPR